MPSTDIKPAWIKFAEEKFGVMNIRMDYHGPRMRLYGKESSFYGKKVYDQSESLIQISWEYNGKVFTYVPLPDIISHDRTNFLFSSSSEKLHYDIDDILQAIKASVEGREEDFDRRSFDKLKVMQRCENFDPLWHREKYR